MSHCLFIHDFFQDGRLDVLAEVREMQVYGQWTEKMRAAWVKSAKACYERSKRTHPLGSSYYAGRIVGLRSAITANYPELDPQFHGKMVFISIGDEKKVMCLECGDDASWKCHPDGSFHLAFYLCDRCKQEQVRTQDSLTVFGWDPKSRELAPLPVALSESDLELAKVTFPLGVLVACDISNVLWPTDRLSMLTELGMVLLVRGQGPNIVRLLFWLCSRSEQE
jgi:hypothetical protein